MFVVGDWNWVLEWMPIRFRRRVHTVCSLFYILSGVCLTVVSGLFTSIILKSYSGDSRVGPTNDLTVSEDSQNSVRYEFGPCLYFAYTFAILEMAIGVGSLFTNPFKTRAPDNHEKSAPAGHPEPYDDLVISFDSYY